MMRGCSVIQSFLFGLSIRYIKAMIKLHIPFPACTASAYPWLLEMPCLLDEIWPYFIPDVPSLAFLPGFPSFLHPPPTFKRALSLFHVHISLLHNFLKTFLHSARALRNGASTVTLTVKKSCKVSVLQVLCILNMPDSVILSIPPQKQVPLSDSQARTL